MTDDEEEDLPFDECAFETLLTGSQGDRVFEEAGFPYQRGPVPMHIPRSQQMKRKTERELAQSAEGSGTTFHRYQQESAMDLALQLPSAL